jgi:acyl-CoA synthetase
MIGATRSDTPEHRKYTEGRPLQGCEVRLVDEQGRDVPNGTAGEILSRGAELFFGYVDPTLTDLAIDADGWYHTQDLAVRDDEGYFTIADRIKDIIIRGGENISAAEVEEVLLQMPGMSEVAVVAAPDDRLGEHSCAFVAPIAGNAAPSLDDVRAHFATAGIARQKWPEEVRVVEQFPRTPTGKIKKQELREALRREANASRA